MSLLFSRFYISFHYLIKVGRFVMQKCMLSWSTCTNSNILNYLIKEVSFSLSIRPCIEDKLGNSASQEQVTDFDVTASPKGKNDRPALNDREIWPCRINSREHGLPSKVHFKILF